MRRHLLYPVVFGHLVAFPVAWVPGVPIIIGPRLPRCGPRFLTHRHTVAFVDHQGYRIILAVVRALRVHLQISAEACQELQMGL